MPIHHHLVNLGKRQRAAADRPLVLAIGNLDGVHLGHQALVRTAAALAGAAGHTCAALTFTPHPREYFNPSLRPLTLMRPAAKIKVLGELGVERVIFAKFDHALATMEPEAFIEDFCVGELGAHHIVTGDNFHFGRNRRGDVELLEHTMRELKLGYTCVEPVYDHPQEIYPPRLRGGRKGGKAAGSVNVACPPPAPPASGGGDFGDSAKGEIISSSRVRQVLSGGNVAAAAALLGRPFTLDGRVGHGDKRGRQLGFPTANLPMHGLYLPAFGVYAVRTYINGAARDGIANLGTRPTFNGERPRLEVHIFDWDGDLYGKRLSAELLHYIRPEQTFHCVQMLIGQIDKDMVKAKEWLAASG